MRLWLLFLGVVLLVGCGTAPAQPPAAPAAQFATAAPTEPVLATALPAPTAPFTATPEPVLEPTATTAPTQPIPTATDVPPTAAATLVVPTSPLPTANPTELALASGPVAPTAAPTAALVQFASSDPIRLVIGAINLDRSLIPVGLDEQRVPIVPNHDVGWYTYSARPGAGENIVLWGHVLRFRNTPDIPAPFADLERVALGETLLLYSADGTEHRYIVTEKVLATPDQVEYILPQGRELLTLVSCIGDKVIVEGSVEMTHRLITIAERVP